MTPEQFYNELTKEQKSQIVSMQMDICESGKYKDAQFIQRECWIEAAKTFALNNNINVDWSLIKEINESDSIYQERIKCQQK